MNDNVLKWILSRRSIRRYRAEPVARPLIQRLLTAATWAPSAHNRQPWRFAVILEQKSKVRLASAMGQKLRADLEADGLRADLIEKDIERSFKRITNAPVVILVCLSMDDMDRYPDQRRSRSEWIMAVQSVAMAGQNLLLAAHASGLGACWMCAPLFCPEAVQETMNLPTGWEPQGLITLGHPAEKRLKRRVPLEERTIFLD